MLAYNMLLMMQLLLVLQELLLVQLSNRGGLKLKFFYSLDNFDSVQSHSDSKIGLQVLISDVIKQGSVNSQIT